ncbi:MAG: hypothetical protein K1X65_06565 [Caldilineales bacterium]|nr:hypothetical protein [Caldilineales bacterium]MCW5859961.1 hypothetical protein [Caldilineales bacterium]
MIFCTVGTTDFDPLVKAVDALAPELGEEVVFQIGQGVYEPQHGPWFRLRPSIDDLLAEASLVIGHGGFGTVIEVISLGKPFVGVPNPDRYDRHQEQILRRFAADGHLIACFDLNDLPAAIAQARTTPLRPYTPPETTIHLDIQAFLDALKRPSRA